MSVVISVPRMITLTWSAAPLRPRIESDSQKLRDSANAIVQRPKIATQAKSVRPPRRIGGRCATQRPTTIEPAAGAARKRPRPCGPVCIRSAKIGSSAVAPPKRTEKRSSVMAGSSTGCLNKKRRPIFTLSTTLVPLGSGRTSCAMRATPPSDIAVSTETTAYASAGPAKP